MSRSVLTFCVQYRAPLPVILCVKMDDDCLQGRLDKTTIFVDRLSHCKRSKNFFQCVTNIFYLLFPSFWRISHFQAIGRTRLTKSWQCVLKCSALHFAALQCTAMHSILHCDELHYTALYCTVLHCIAFHCTALSWTIGQERMARQIINDMFCTLHWNHYFANFCEKHGLLRIFPKFCSYLKKYC